MRELWVAQNLAEWKVEAEEERKMREAESTKHKMYRSECRRK